MRCNVAASTGPTAVGAGQPKKQSGKHNDARPCFLFDSHVAIPPEARQNNADVATVTANGDSKTVLTHQNTPRRTGAGAAVGEMTSDRCPLPPAPTGVPVAGTQEKVATVRARSLHG